LWDMKICKYPSRNKGSKRQRINMIVLHATVIDLPQTLQKLCDPQSHVSAHYVISKSGDVYELVEPQYIAWHAGQSQWLGEADVNQFSIGIELVNLNDGIDSYPDVQMRALQSLCQNFMQCYSIPHDRIVGHYEVSPDRKNDPMGFDLHAFRAALRK